MFAKDRQQKKASEQRPDDAPDYVYGIGSPCAIRIAF